MILETSGGEMSRKVPSIARLGSSEIGKRKRGSWRCSRDCRHVISVLFMFLSTVSWKVTASGSSS